MSITPGTLAPTRCFMQLAGSDRAPELARDRADRILKNEGRELEPFVVGTVINFLHLAREKAGDEPFDIVRGVFTEGKHVYTNSGLRRKTHIQICVPNQANIHGVFQVQDRAAGFPRTRS